MKFFLSFILILSWVDVDFAHSCEAFRPSEQPVEFRSDIGTEAEKLRFIEELKEERPLSEYGPLSWSEWTSARCNANGRED